MKIAFAGDSAGNGLASILAEHFGKEHDVVLLSEHPQGDNEFYANMADRVAHQVLNGEFDRGVLVCGTGIGVCISANKVPGIRAAHCHDTYSAERASLSNNAQIITMGARVIGPELAKAITSAFLVNTFDVEGRSAANVAAIDGLDTKYKGS